VEKPANDDDLFGGKSPFKGFRLEAVDWPEINRRECQVSDC
jgi:hypothetical protein